MSERADKFITEALKLSQEERARIATQLIASFDGPPDSGASSAWAKEIDGRVDTIRADGARGDDWHIVHDRIAARLRSK